MRCVKLIFQEKFEVRVYLEQSKGFCRYIENYLREGEGRIDINFFFFYERLTLYSTFLIDKI